MKSALLRAGLTVGILTLQACSENTPPEAASPVAPPKPPSAGAPGAGASNQASSRVLVGGTWLELRDCELAYGEGAESGRMNMQLPSPCQFARRKDGSVRVVESQSGSVLLVESSRRESTPGADGALVDCDTRLRGIMVTPQGVQLSRDTQKVATCAPAQWDEKMFHVFALHPVAPSER